MQVRAGRPSRASRKSDELTLFHSGRARHADLAQVSVQRLEAIAVVDQDCVAVADPRPAGEYDKTAVRRINRRAGRRAQVDARVSLLKVGPGQRLVLAGPDKG